MIIPEDFKPKFQYDLIRLGKDNDGGYLVEKNSVINSDILISAGISWDFSFEKDYINLNNKSVSCYDHTINFTHYIVTWILIFLLRIVKFSKFKKIYSAYLNILKPIKLNSFFNKKNVNYFKYGVGLKNEKILTMEEIFKQHSQFNKIFLKIDIEGDEYRLLESIVNNSKKLIGLVIEFHNFDLNIEKIKNFIKKFDCELVHIHPNNSGPLGENSIPTIVEFVFAKLPKRMGSRKKIKHDLDQPNIKNKNDIEFEFD
tara:strand:+ start:8749 stop:9519 length:771 start_codon:yes stop_codon:yes gene_type:complete